MTPQTTKNRILHAALNLFNEHGTAVVSTNHIAAEAGVSPGNLYYHFRNKEEIIREILERMFQAWGPAWTTESSDSQPSVGDLLTTIHLSFQMLWEFRFFYRESVALMIRDPLLAERHATMQQQRIAEQERYYRWLVDAGLMHVPSDPSAMPDLARTGWILATNWLAFVEAGGETVDEAQLRTGERVILRVFRPYLTEAAEAQLTQQHES